MVIEFETERASRYVLDALLSFIGDPPDTDFQTGYLACLLDIYREGLNQGDGDDRIDYLASFIRGETELDGDEDDLELVDGLSAYFNDNSIGDN